MTTHDTPLTRKQIERLTAQVQSQDFDHPFTLNVDGILSDAPTRVAAPEVYHVEDPNVDLEIYGPWHTILERMSNQHGYGGPVMHASEQIGEGILGRLLAHAEAMGGEAIFVTVAVEVMPDEEDPEPAPAGWTILCRDADADEPTGGEG